MCIRDRDDPWEPEPEETPEPEDPESEPEESASAASGGGASSAQSSEVESSELSSAASSSTLSLPDISGFPSAGTSVSVTTTQRSNLIGIICWVIIGIGILIVVIVRFRSTQKPGKGRRPGRKHYRRTKLKRTRKHLLADRYYKKSKYHSRHKR